ncbi:hypothetical protein [Ruminococcus flavefaciens]|nr:hypothetical protein [Ruminococcus flavefaciens]
MLKIVLIIGCVLILVGMIGLDIFISRDLEKPSKKKKTDDDSDNEE